MLFIWLAWLFCWSHEHCMAIYISIHLDLPRVFWCQQTSLIPNAVKSSLSTSLHLFHKMDMSELNMQMKKIKKSDGRHPSHMTQPFLNPCKWNRYHIMPPYNYHFSQTNLLMQASVTLSLGGIIQIPSYFGEYLSTVGLHLLCLGFYQLFFQEFYSA